MQPQYKFPGSTSIGYEKFASQFRKSAGEISSPDLDSARARNSAHFTFGIAGIFDRSAGTDASPYRIEFVVETSQSGVDCRENEVAVHGGQSSWKPEVCSGATALAPLRRGHNSLSRR